MGLLHGDLKLASLSPVHRNRQCLSIETCIVEVSSRSLEHAHKRGSDVVFAGMCMCQASCHPKDEEEDKEVHVAPCRYQTRAVSLQMSGRSLPAASPQTASCLRLRPGVGNSSCGRCRNAVLSPPSEPIKTASLVCTKLDSLELITFRISPLIFLSAYSSNT